mmetsp:Transcript_58748/g.139994  ORF Transcript_58748/g.139994 Transcript_58748/m.139994 type:complete len:95 (-) Transcript_58748:22-306(-)
MRLREKWSPEQKTNKRQLPKSRWKVQQAKRQRRRMPKKRKVPQALDIHAHAWHLPFFATCRQSGVHSFDPTTPPAPAVQLDASGMYGIVAIICR